MVKGENISNAVNRVGSFSIGIITFSGNPIGVCLKFWTYENNTYLAHFDMTQIQSLLDGLMKYIQFGEHTKFAVTVEENKEFIKTLDPNHPYFTLKTKTPDLSEEESGTLKKSTCVVGSKFNHNKDTLEIKIDFKESSTLELALHEYLVCALVGYIVNTFNDVNLAVKLGESTLN